jgi:hypothetical protein
VIRSTAVTAVKQFIYLVSIEKGICEARSVMWMMNSVLNE